MFNFITFIDYTLNKILTIPFLFLFLGKFLT